MIAIKTADLRQDFKNIADRIIKGEKVLISRPRNENLVILTEQEYNELNAEKRIKALESFRENLKAMREQSVLNGTDNMTMDEINEIVEEVRRERKDREGQ